MIMNVPTPMQNRGFTRDDCMKWTAGLLKAAGLLAMGMAVLIHWFLYRLLELLLPDYQCGRRGNCKF